MKTIPFDIEKAKAGAKLVNRSGQSVRIICFDARQRQPIVGLAADSEGCEDVCNYNTDGTYWTQGGSLNDLFILVEPKLRPWTPEEVPVGALFKWSDTCRELPVLIVGADVSKFYFGQSASCTFAYALEHGGLHSTDNGATWKPCGVESAD